MGTSASNWRDRFSGFLSDCLASCSAEQYDSDLGLYYLRARYYNPATGRFLSRDPEDGKPVDPKTLHKYLYAAGDPVNRIDPRGREELGEEGYADSLIAEARPVIHELAKSEIYALCRAIAVIWTAENPNFSPDELTLYYAACVATLGGDW